MRLTRRELLGSAALAASAAVLPAPRARAQGPTIRIGVLTDMSGPYRDVTGPLSVECTKLAVADFGPAAHGLAVEVLAADHQNKADIGSGIARKWFDEESVDVILDVPNSGVALAVASLAHERNKIFIGSGAATSDLTGKACNANVIHWSYDTWMLAHAIASSLVKSSGADWYFITPDYAFGKALQRDMSQFVLASGGKMLGAALYPFPGTGDFSSFLLQATASGAQVIGLANAGQDMVNCIKQAHEFGVKQTLAAPILSPGEVRGLGLEAAQGIVTASGFYWDLNDRTRAFAKRLWAHAPDTSPNVAQAGCYSATTHYLKAVLAAGAAAAKADGAGMVARMKATPTDDDAFGPGRIREDGRKLHPCYLLQVKAPSESHGPLDAFKAIATIQAEEAFRPISEGGCPLIKT